MLTYLLGNPAQIMKDAHLSSEDEDGNDDEGNTINEEATTAKAEYLSTESRQVTGFEKLHENGDSAMPENQSEDISIETKKQNDTSVPNGQFSEVLESPEQPAVTEVHSTDVETTNVSADQTDTHVLSTLETLKTPTPNEPLKFNITSDGPNISTTKRFPKEGVSPEENQTKNIASDAKPSQTDKIASESCIIEETTSEEVSAKISDTKSALQSHESQLTVTSSMENVNEGEVKP